MKDIYPDELDTIPSWVMEKLTHRLLTEHNNHSLSASSSSSSLSSSIPASSTSSYSISADTIQEATIPSSTLSSTLPSPTSPVLTSYQYNANASHLCQGTLLSRQQYLKDVAEWKYEDARILKRSNGTSIMSEQDVSHWTAAAFNHGAANA